jgi:hypothetical protein
MQPADLNRFCEILNGLAAVKPGKDLTKQALAIWWNSMQDWSIEEFAAAASHLALSVEFMPSPFHFQQLRKAAKPAAAEAWAIALERCKHWRIARDARDVIDRAVAGLGGYRAIAMADIERDLPHFQRRFAEYYAQLEDVESIRHALPSIAPQLQTPTLLGREGKL